MLHGAGTGGVGVLIMWALGTRPFSIVVTDRRVLFMRASFLTAPQPSVPPPPQA
jgi:hypothetical protein